MTRFSQVLASVDARLTVPEPARSRILLEIAADMEDLHGEYLERGLSEADAGAAVEDHFDLSDEVLRELVQLHDTPLQRSLEGLSGQVREVWSRLLMAILALFVVIGSGVLLFRFELYQQASDLVWVIMPVLALGLVLAVGQARRVFRKGTEGRAHSGSGRGGLLGVAGLILAITAAGLWLELYLSALRIRAAPGETLIHLVGWLHMTSATLVIALSGSLLLGFLWFFLESQVRRQELLAVERLLEGAS